MKRTKFSRICTWCGKEIGFCFIVGNYVKGPHVCSHGVCDECYEKVKNNSLKEK